MKKKRVMILCLANYCRSPLAHAILDKLISEGNSKVEIAVDSFGLIDKHVGGSADSRTRENAKQHGIEIAHRAQMLTAEALKNSDIVFTLDHTVHEEVLKLMPPKCREKFYLFRQFDSVLGDLDVPDPYYDGTFEEVYQIIERNCKIIFKKLVSEEL